MSLEHDPSRQNRRRGGGPMLPRVAVSVSEFSSTTKLSKPTLYRMMQRGQLRFAQIGAIRRIPVSEYQRLGLIDNAQ
jgi:excisionase family DNA binding protein